MRVDVHVHRHRPGAEQVVHLLTERERRAEHRDVKSGRAERPGDRVGAARLALVEDHDRDRARRLRVERLVVEGHVPRWISATLPGVKPAKSAASQPAFDELGVGARRELVVVRPPARRRSRHRCPSTSSSRNPCPSDVGPRVRRGARRTSACASSWKNGKSNGWTDRVVARGLELVDDVVHRRLVARRTRCAGAAVGVRDVLKRLLVPHHPGDGDRLSELGDLPGGASAACAEAPASEMRTAAASAAAMGRMEKAISPPLQRWGTGAHVPSWLVAGNPFYVAVPTVSGLSNTAFRTAQGALISCVGIRQAEERSCSTV